MGCGMVGLISGKEVPGFLFYSTLKVLRHARNRGDDGAGVMFSKNNGFFIEHWEGTAKDLPKEKRQAMEKEPIVAQAMMSLGHARYGTCGTIDIENNHPVHAEKEDVQVALIMNGELSFTERWRKDAIKNGVKIHKADNDSSNCAAKICADYHRTRELGETLQEFYKEGFPFGGFSILGVLHAKQGHFFFYLRDGIRPLFSGHVSNSQIFFSETSHINGLAVMDYEEVPAGEIGWFDFENRAWHKRNMKERLNGVAIKAMCPFEVAYFANYDSRVNGKTMDGIRRAFGKELAREHPPEDGEVVSWVPKSGISATQGYYEEAVEMGKQVDFKQILMRGKKSEEAGERSFLGHRSKSLTEKLSRKFIINEHDVKDANIVLIDDSIVRGNVSAWLAKMLAKSGAKRVRFMSAWPPMTGQCRAGVDLFYKDLIATRYLPKEEVLKHPEKLEERLKEGYENEKVGFVKFDEVAYVSMKGVEKVFRKHLKGKLCTGCYSGKYSYIHSDNKETPPGWLKTFIKENNVAVPEGVKA